MENPTVCLLWLVKHNVHIPPLPLLPLLPLLLLLPLFPRPPPPNRKRIQNPTILSFQDHYDRDNLKIEQVGLIGTQD